MSIAYDSFVSAFLDKVKTYEFLKLEEDGRDNIVLGYFRRALSGFKWVCEYDFSLYDAETRCFTDEFKEAVWPVARKESQELAGKRRTAFCTSSSKIIRWRTNWKRSCFKYRN